MDSSAKTKKNESKAKKITSWILSAISILFLVIAVFFLIATIAAQKKESRAVEIFGYSFSIVQTDSMTGEIEVGELITVKICKIDEAKVGVNAVYIASSGPLEGRQIVHKVIKAGVDEKGSYIITQGVKEGAPIDNPVYAEQFVGIAVRHSAFLGRVAKFFSTPVNWILILALVIGIPCTYWLIMTIIKLRKEAKQEKTESSAAEREKLKQQLLEEYQQKENNDRKK